MDSRSRLGTRWLFTIAEFVLPKGRSQWAHAMRAEANFIDSGPAALSFAAGCLRAACLERLRATFEKRAAVLAAGSGIGAAFSAHAAVDGSGGWPLIWPLFGGAGTILLIGRHRTRPGLRCGAWLGLRAGAVAGLLFAVVGALLISLAGQVPLDSRLHVVLIGALACAGLSGAGGSAATLFLRLR